MRLSDELLAWYYDFKTKARAMFCRGCAAKESMLRLDLLRYVHETEPPDIVCQECGTSGERIAATDWKPSTGVGPKEKRV